MPADCGRDAGRLAEVSRGSGIHVLAPTGLHHARFYDERHWSGRASAEQMAGLFAADIEVGIDAYDYGGPIVERTPHRAGVIKVGGSGEFPTERDRRVFEAAAMAQRRTGCPILTHCEEGRWALEQVTVLTGHGADPAHIVLSHVDKVVDRAYHRDIAATGAVLEYDQAFRWKDADNGTLQLLEWMVEDGLAGQVVLGLDAARQGYWRAWGGSPGMGYLLGDFSRQMRERGIGDPALEAFFVRNPAAAFAFIERPDGPGA
jgi:phosphotriesterase-related protein